jgi:hypothetical protein
MGQADPLPHRQIGKRSPTRRGTEAADVDYAGIDALMKENAELRQLVVQLSKLVIKNAIPRR